MPLYKDIPLQKVLRRTIMYISLPHRSLIWYQGFAEFRVDCGRSSAAAGEDTSAASKASGRFCTKQKHPLPGGFPHTLWKSFGLLHFCRWVPDSQIVPAKVGDVFQERSDKIWWVAGDSLQILADGANTVSLCVTVNLSHGRPCCPGHVRVLTTPGVGMLSQGRIPGIAGLHVSGQSWDLLWVYHGLPALYDFYIFLWLRIRVLQVYNSLRGCSLLNTAEKASMGWGSSSDLRLWAWSTWVQPVGANPMGPEMSWGRTGCQWLQPFDASDQFGTEASDQEAHFRKRWAKQTHWLLNSTQL